jgi:hypothetical protein
VKTPRAMTSRSIRANHSSTWLSQDEYDAPQKRRVLDNRGGGV